MGWGYVKFSRPRLSTVVLLAAFTGTLVLYGFVHPESDDVRVPRKEYQELRDNQTTRSPSPGAKPSGKPSDKPSGGPKPDGRPTTSSSPSPTPSAEPTPSQPPSPSDETTSPSGTPETPVTGEDQTP